MSSSSKPTPGKPSHTRRNILLTVLAIVIIAAGGAGYYLLKKNATPVAAKSSSVQTATVTRGNIKLFASGTGTLVSPTQATFGFHSSGQVTQVLVKVGDVVDAGQLLARLDDTAAQAQYTQAVNALNELTSPSALATTQQAIATDQVNIANYRATLAYLISPDVLYWTEEVARAEQDLAQAQADAAATPSADTATAVQKAQAVLAADKNALAQATLDYWNDYVPATFLTVLKSGRTTTKIVIPPSDAESPTHGRTITLAKQSLVDDQNYLTAITTGDHPRRLHRHQDHRAGIGPTGSGHRQNRRGQYQPVCADPRDGPDDRIFRGRQRRQRLDHHHRQSGSALYAGNLSGPERLEQHSGRVSGRT